jgi:hypothetical protein
MPGTSNPRLLLGSCPDSWGVWYADDPLQTPWSRFLDELVESATGTSSWARTATRRPMPMSCPTSWAAAA